MSSASFTTHRRPGSRCLIVLLASLAGPAAWAQTHPSVPALQSRPGAAYTLYLDFGGFSFNGSWGGNGTPGVTTAYSVDGDYTTFSATELSNIQNIWSRVAEKYSAFNINVTTVDPAIAAAQTANDSQRQAYYDSQSRLMHTVIGGAGGWSGGGGVSYLATTPTVGSFNGAHTNWVFSDQAPNNVQFVGEATAHENGHGLGLYHQSDYSGNTLGTEYSLGTGTGAGSIAPTMGNSYYAERGLWKSGTAHVNNSGPTLQTDVAIIANDPGMGGFINDGIGHALALATALPLNGTVINTALASGVIVPKNAAAPVSSGSANYTSDFWSFITGGGQVALNLISGRSTITPGIADPGAMLDAVLKIYNSGGSLIATASQSTGSTFLESLTLSLSAGTYYAEVASAGDPGNLGFFDMGSYFLSGSVVTAVPEAGTAVLMGLGLMGLFIRRRQRQAAHA